MAPSRTGPLTKRYRILPIEQLHRLSEHKYASEGRSIIDRQLQGFWNFVVELMPRWLAPNLITWVGLCVNILCNLVLIYHNPSMEQGVRVPPAVYVACAFGLFLYQTLDNIDGKQARRTGSATPLGELFDHGCDSFSTIIVITGVLTMLQAGPGYTSFAVAMLACSLYYISHWECYVKGRLHFNEIDVTEAQYMIIAGYLMTAFFSESLWDVTVAGLELRQIYLATSCFAALVTAFNFLNSILEGGPGPAGTTIAETSVLSPLMPLFAMLMGLNHMQSYSFYDELPTVFLLGAGCTTAKLTCKLIVAHMSKSQLDQFDVVHLVPVVFIMTEFTGLSHAQRGVLCCAFWFCDLVAYGVCVVLDICQHLDIGCFYIKHKPQVKAS
eukprot:TRINITY_DN7963_c0_g1_i3.p1 TRINITY_DN7963_c0_g1~~TRINITY_DN7963_c0_g1_i3.p1  ORF type:complete len:383 (+),score=73.01 TRINITY_DN7963_c0_g1_i3:65-1213(+)